MSQWLKKQLKHLDSNKEKSKFHERMKKLASDVKSKKESLSGVQTGFPSSVASIFADSQFGGFFQCNKRKKAKTWFSKGSKSKKLSHEENLQVSENKPPVDSNNDSKYVCVSSPHERHTQMASRPSLDECKSHQSQSVGGNSVEQSINRPISSEPVFAVDSFLHVSPSPVNSGNSPEEERRISNNPEDVESVTKKNLQDRVLTDAWSVTHTRRSPSRQSLAYKYSFMVLLLILMSFAVFLDAKKTVIPITVSIFLVLKLATNSQRSGMGFHRLIAFVQSCKSSSFTDFKATETGHDKHSSMPNNQNCNVENVDRSQNLKRGLFQRSSSSPIAQHTRKECIKSNAENLSGSCVGRRSSHISRATVKRDMQSNSLRVGLGRSVSLPNPTILQETTERANRGYATSSSLLIIVLIGLAIGRVNAFLLVTCWCIFMNFVFFLCENGGKQCHQGELRHVTYL